MKESSVTTGEKDEESKQDLTESFSGMAAKQKAHGDTDPSLLWCGGQTCWISVSFCDLVHNSFNLATGGKNGEQGVSVSDGGRWAD